MNESAKTAESATAVTWASWLIAHIVEVNDVLQLIVLLLGVATGVFALYWHIMKLRKS
jgi:hypothetical protein